MSSFVSHAPRVLLFALFAGSSGCSVIRADAADVRPALELEVRERFYDVSAEDAGQLNRELARNGRRETGRSAYALTRWRLGWSYIPLQVGRRCVVEAPRVEVEIVTTLPRWKQLAAADESLARDWALFRERLELHESGHQDIALRSGSDLLSRLRKLEASDCGTLRAEARRVAAEQSAAGNADQAGFDRATRYGLKVVGP